MTITSRLDVIDLAREPEFSLGSMVVRPSTREVIAATQAQIIEPRMMQVLVALARRRGEVVSRDELFRSCWEGRIVGDDAMHRCISRLRRLENADTGFTIEAIPRVGYRLLETGRPDKPDQPPANASHAPAQSVWYGRKRYLAAGFVVVLAVLLGAASLWLNRQPKVIEVVAPHVPTVAVLPFTPLYAGNGAREFGDAISNAVVNALSTTSLRVVSPAQAFQFRGDAKARAAGVLHADILVDGDIRIEGDKISVSARVDSTRYGVTLYAKVYERSLAHQADVPDQVAAGIAGAIGFDIAVRFLSDPNVRDPKLLAAFLQLPNSWSENGLAAYEIGRKMVKAAPDDPLALSVFAAQTADADLPQKEKPAARAAAREAALKAIRLYPHFAEAYIGLAALALPDEAESEAIMRKGLAVDPESMPLNGNVAGILMSHGRGRDALPLVEKVIGRFNYRDFIVDSQIWILFQLNRLNDAKTVATRAQKLWPEWGHPVALFDAAVFQGDYDGGDAVLRDPEMGPMLRPVGAAPVFSDILRAMRSRRPADIDAVVKDCMTTKPNEWRGQQPCVIAFNVLGRLDAAFHLPNGDNFYTAIFWPQAAPMRADGRFLELTKRLGHFAYWKATHTRPDFCAMEDVPVCRELARGEKTEAPISRSPP